MISLRFEQIALAVDGELKNLVASEMFSGNVVTDSNLVKPGDLFVAIKGERFDGHEFATQAITNGAVAVLSSKTLDGLPHVLVNQESDSPEDFSQPTVWALAKLAKFVHQNLKNLITIAITGSSGKTTTKDLITQLSDLFGESVCTKGSSNNEIGVPMTVLGCNLDTKVLVVEMGARHLGNIKYLTEIAKPNYSIITHIGTAHLEIFGSQQNIIDTKAEIITCLTESDWAIINFDDKNSLSVVNRTQGKIFSFAIDNKADLVASDISLDELARPSFKLIYLNDQVHVNLKFSGKHNVANALAAAAPFLIAGFSLSQIAEKLNQAKTINSLRMEVSELNDEIILINDSYNANAESVKAALEALAEIGRDQRTIAILGEMKEIGDKSFDFHFEIGQKLAQLQINRLLVVGSGAKGIIEGAQSEKTWIGEATFFENNESLATFTKELVRARDVILIKASRAIALDQVASEIIKFKGNK